MPPIDPSSAASVSPALRDYLSHTLGHEVSFAATPEAMTEGRSTFVYAFQLAAATALADEWTRPLVLRVFPLLAGDQQTEQAKREAAIQTWVAERGYPAPRVLGVETGINHLGRPFIIMERVPGIPLLDRIGFDVGDAFRLAERMADLQAELHGLPTDGFPVPYRPAIDSTLAHYRDLIDAHGLRDLERAYRVLDEHRALALPEEPAVCHNDFHPFNLVMNDDGNIGVIDWQVAALADRHACVAWTMFILTAVRLPPRNPLEAILQNIARLFQPAFRRHYIERYRTHFDLEPARLSYWEAVRAYGLWQAIAIWKRGGGLERGIADDNDPFWTATTILAIRDYVRDRFRELRELTSRS